MKTYTSLDPLTLAGAFDQFLEISSFARRTRESYTEDLAPLFVEVGQKPVTDLSADVLQTFLARQESLAPATYNRRLAALRSFIRWLREQGWLAVALLDGVQRKPEGKRAVRALDAQKVESVLRTIEDPRDRALFWLIYDGGLRCQEALAIDIDDMSWSDRSIYALPMITPKLTSNALAGILLCAVWNATSLTTARRPNAKRVSGNADRFHGNASVRALFTLIEPETASSVVARRCPCQDTSVQRWLRVFHRAPACVSVRAGEHHAWSSASAAS